MLGLLQPTASSTLHLVRRLRSGMSKEVKTSTCEDVVSRLRVPDLHYLLQQMSVKVPKKASKSELQTLALPAFGKWMMDADWGALVQLHQQKPRAIPMRPWS